MIMTSIFDWQGPQFLSFYGIAFLLALLWSISRRKSVLRPLNPPPGSQPKLEDPIEIAYLAGGPARCTEVALVSLIEKGALTWKKSGFLSKGTLSVSGPLPAASHWFERTLYSTITAKGGSGLALSELSPTVRQNTPALEGRLAKLGLRPTASELSGKGLSAILPLLTLLVVGGVKLLVGFSRDKPIGFLIACLIITFVVMLILKASITKLTPAGQSLLDQMRAGRQSTPQPSITSVALFGIAGATAYAGMPEIDPSMVKELTTMSSTHSSSNGCGNSGCSSDSDSGGGGCGGCGD